MNNKKPSLLLVALAFAAVYIIWGSTYFFIEIAVKYIPPMILGAMRFLAAGLIMLGLVAFRGEKIWNKKAIIPSVVSGVLMLFMGNGAVIWAEQYLPSSFVAIFLASAPMWFLLLDKMHWHKNFKNKYTIIGVSIGMAGVVALFYEKISGANITKNLLPLLVLCLANIGWTLGSLYSKYKVKYVSPSVNAAWQMLVAGMVFLSISLLSKNTYTMQWQAVPVKVWLSVGYLIIFGSIIGYSAYVFLLNVRSATQVSSYAYVNPLVAVVLGVFINHDRLTAMQLTGLAIILFSVFFINLSKKEEIKIKARLNTEAG